MAASRTILQGGAGTLSMSGALFAKNYGVGPRLPHDSMSATSWYKHFTTRGHIGPVVAIRANADASMIVTGGADFSVRVWHMNTTYEAYEVVAILNVDVPEDQLAHAEEAQSICNRLKEVFVPRQIKWEEEPKQGVTVVYPVCIQDTLGGGSYRNGPILCGTGHGSLHMLDISGLPHRAPEVRSWRGLHEGAILDIGAIVMRDEGGEVELLVMTTGEDKCSHMFRMKTSAQPRPTFFSGHGDKDGFVYKWFLGGGGRRELGEEMAKVKDRQDPSWLRFDSMVRHREPRKHENPLIEIHGLSRREDKQLTTFVGLTTSGMHLLNIDGEELHTLRVASTRSSRISIQGTVEAREVLLFAVGLEGRAPTSDGEENESPGRVGVWCLEDGVLARNDQDSGGITFMHPSEGPGGLLGGPTHRTEVEPLCIYDRAGGCFDVDRAGAATSFAVQLRPDKTTVDMWRLEVVPSQHLAILPDHPAQILVAPGKENTIQQLSHGATVWSLQTIDFNGAAVTTGCENGCAYCWDLDGVDKGQIYAEMRSLSMLELVLPPLVIFITSLQLLSFAFGPPPKSAEETEEHWATRTQHITVLGHDLFEYTVEELFWPKVKAVLYVIVGFFAIALGGLDEVMDGLVAKAYDLPLYKAEKLSIAPGHLLVKFLSAARGFVYLFAQLCSTVLVVPMMTALASSLHCVEHEGRLVVNSAPDYVCFQGAHLKLFLVLLLVVPLYLFLLVPFAVVFGDATYVPSTCMFEWKVWKKDNPWKHAAARKATTIHSAFLHVTPQFAFITAFVELVGKIVMPVGATLLMQDPLPQMIVVASTNFVMWFTTVLYAPYVDHKFCVVVQDCKLMIFLASLTGIYTVALNDTKTNKPMIALAVMVGMTFVMVMVKMCIVPSDRPVTVRIDADSLENQSVTGNALNDKTAERAPLLSAESKPELSKE
mmetsp:Transcript_59003/g.170592  ORF Transcript_59003/g.170592 Transcript_59003/m.170592 type:complete len:936 (+) Transcript_59003:64-2871(+)|eukprot:CAMPEP_0176046992 /NCGR_PEP_ID=MMETSP0120_2-20121206/23337_1 /TAXON_ID=160619 /ORGANISM="Kryptoperidinium foliaceum, Strain CCMP 1326" /LENGTH=935 /DNA_ID=CAMNT_0017380407 /DNA_START=64 /DNA_END=2871 /DNA_ORIENTATION=-